MKKIVWQYIDPFQKKKEYHRKDKKWSMQKKSTNQAALVIDFNYFFFYLNWGFSAHKPPLKNMISENLITVEKSPLTSQSLWQIMIMTPSNWS